MHWFEGGVAENPAVCQLAFVEASEGYQVRVASVIDAEVIDCPVCLASIGPWFDAMPITAQHRRLAAAQSRQRLPKPGEAYPRAYASALARIVRDTLAAAEEKKQIVETRIARTSAKRYGAAGPEGKVVKFPGGEADGPGVERREDADDRSPEGADGERAP